MAAEPETGGRPTVLLAYPPGRRERLYPDDVVRRLRSHCEVRTLRAAADAPPLAWVEEAHGCRYVIADRVIDAPEEAFARLPDLRAFVRGAMDVRTVDLDAAARHGVTVLRSAPDAWIDPVCELIIGLIVGLFRHVPDAAVAYRAGREPEPRMGRSLAGATLGVVGYGNLGRRLAELGRALRMRVRVCDPYARDVPDDLPHDDLPTLLAASDVVVLLAAHGPETENLIDAAALARMRPDAVLVNAGRGGLVDEGALRRALTGGTIAGAALDVGRAPDDRPSLELAALPNVIATPHVGGLVAEAVRWQAARTVEQIAALERDERAEGTVV